MINFSNILEEWSREAKKTENKEERLRLWIKHAALHYGRFPEDIDKFTGNIEERVFGK